MSETNKVEVPIVITAFRVDDVKPGDIVTVKSGDDKFCQFQVRSCDGSEEFHPVGGLSVGIGEAPKGCRGRVRDRDAELEFAVSEIIRAHSGSGCNTCKVSCYGIGRPRMKNSKNCRESIKKHIIEAAQKGAKSE